MLLGAVITIIHIISSARAIEGPLPQNGPEILNSIAPNNGNTFPVAEPNGPEAYFLNKLLSLSYNKNQRPEEHTGNPTKVILETVIYSIDFVDDLKMQIGLELILRQSWTDLRLAYFEVANGPNKTKHAEYTKLTDHTQIWFPDTYFLSARDGQIQKFLKPNMMTRVFENGTVLMSTRLITVLNCPMNFRWLPFDVQICTINIESYAMTKKELILEWSKYDNMAFRLAEGISSLAKFELVKVENGNNNDHPQKYYSTAYFRFYFKRQLSYFLTNFFFQYLIIVSLSWTPFLYDVQGIETRASIGVTIVLTSITQSQAQLDLLPPCSYTRAFDIFYGSCLWCIILSFILIAIIDCIRRGWQFLPNWNFTDSVQVNPVIMQGYRNEIGKINKLSGIKEVGTQTHIGKNNLGLDLRPSLQDQAEINLMKAKKVNAFVLKACPIVFILYIIGFCAVCLLHDQLF